jgi:MoxR-like ATPase
MSDTNIQFYEGNKLKAPFNKEEKKPRPYIPDNDLIEAVKLAQILQRPLLLKGEPGCGKTRLAEAVAFELFEDKYKEHYFEWPIKSNSKAQDGLYVINHLQQLRDANVRSEVPKKLSIKLGGDYLELGPLGKAFQSTNTMGTSIPPIVLIDEIDKADIDFPNDLLQELENMKFIIPGAVDDNDSPLVISAKEGMKPLIIITSNDEKTLPPAFLRRCLFYYIEFPNREDLEMIVSSHYPSLTKELMDKTLDKFIQTRDKINDDALGNKNISTSELLDWVKVISYYTAEGKVIPDLEKQFPYYQVLLKDLESVKQFMGTSSK